MIQKLKLITLLLAVIFSPMALSAQTLTKVIGVIYEVGNSSIVINDSRFRLLSTVNVYLDNKEKGRISDLKKGDEVLLNLVTINKRRAVDTISVIQKTESK